MEDLENVLAYSWEKLADALHAHLGQHGARNAAAWTDNSRHQNRLIHRLAIAGHTDGIEVLTAAGVDVNVQRVSDGCTPLHLALWHDKLAAAAALKRCGADVHLANDYGETPMEVEQQRDKRYVCWHQQADLLMNVAPFMLRGVFRQRWNVYAGAHADVGLTITEGSDARTTLTTSACVRQGASTIFVEDDLRGKLVKGQSLWLNGVRLEAALDPVWSPPAGRLLGGGELKIAERWKGAGVQKGKLEVQRLPPELRLPPGLDARRKIRRGRLDDWDITLLAHFLCDDQCRLAQNLVPCEEHRVLIRKLKDTRNTAGLHLGRAEVEPTSLDNTASLVQEACDKLLPSLSDEVRRLIAEVRGRSVVPSDILKELERKAQEEHDRAQQMEECLQTAQRFSAHVPPGAFGGNSQQSDGTSEWSATRVASTWAGRVGRADQGATRCRSVGECLQALTLPENCNESVVSRCLELALACPLDQTMLIVVCRTDLADIMLKDVNDSTVHARWKERRLSVNEVDLTHENLRDWCLPDGVLVSGEQGRVLRVTAVFRPPSSEWKIKSPKLKCAVDIACHIPATIVTSERGVVSVTEPTLAKDGAYVQLSSIDHAASEFDMATVSCSGDTNTEGGMHAPSGSTAQIVGKNFWPHMQQREHLTNALLPQASEQVRHWGEGTAPITEDNAAQVAENTAKWLWGFVGVGMPDRAETEEALSRSKAVLDRLDSISPEMHIPQVLLPMGELYRLLGDVDTSIQFFNRARKLAAKVSDFEIGFSVHHSLFNIYVRMEKLTEARAILAGSQGILNREKEGRLGPGMEEFIQAKQLFQTSSQARLDAKIALKSKDMAALQSTQQLLEDTPDAMLKARGGPLRGNTNKNVAELFSLLCIVSWETGDKACTRRALEHEIPLRRSLQQEPEVAIALVNLGQVCLALDDADAAERHVSEAQDLLQGLSDEASNIKGFSFQSMSTLREALWIHAQCAKRREDLVVAVAKLNRLHEVLAAAECPSDESIQEVAGEIATLKALQQRSTPKVQTDKDRVELGGKPKAVVEDATNEDTESATPKPFSSVMPAADATSMPVLEGESNQCPKSKRKQRKGGGKKKK